MPARIDPAERRAHVVDAAFRLVVAHGMEGLSLRKVAEEAGLNIGSVRHYFEGHADLLAAAAGAAGERMGDRLARHDIEAIAAEADADSALRLALGVLEEVLPLDEARREETIVVLEIITASRTREVFRPVVARMGADLRAVIASVLEALAVDEPARRAVEIAALIGGLSVDTVTTHGTLRADEVRLALGTSLARLL